LVFFSHQLLAQHRTLIKLGILLSYLTAVAQISVAAIIKKAQANITVIRERSVVGTALSKSLHAAVGIQEKELKPIQVILRD
jgi:hypothetical protein